jgi:hypothetical protein
MDHGIQMPSYVSTGMAFLGLGKWRVEKMIRFYEQSNFLFSLQQPVLCQEKGTPLGVQNPSCFEQECVNVRFL